MLTVSPGQGGTGRRNPLGFVVFFEKKHTKLKGFRGKTYYMIYYFSVGWIFIKTTLDDCIL